MELIKVLSSDGTKVVQCNKVKKYKIKEIEVIRNEFIRSDREKNKK